MGVIWPSDSRAWPPRREEGPHIEIVMPAEAGIQRGALAGFRRSAFAPAIVAWLRRDKSPE